LTGSGQTQERGIVGDTPNLATRPQEITEPNTVVIGVDECFAFSVLPRRSFDFKARDHCDKPFCSRNSSLNYGSE
jgi:hypothetical protein